MATMNLIFYLILQRKDWQYNFKINGYYLLQFAQQKNSKVYEIMHKIHFKFFILSSIHLFFTHS